MAVQASQKVLESTNIDPKEIGLVVFVSSTPEYLSPINALQIHRALNLNKKAAAYDMNANCCGMLIAMNQIYKVMKFDTSIKYSLIIGSDQLFRYADKTEPVTYSSYSESACAVLLENSDDSSSDFIDSSSSVDTSAIDFVKFPSGGFSEFISSDKYIDKNKMIIKSGDEYGYTGVTSPLIALADSISKNKIKRGDYVILWTAGAGIISSGTLIRY